jgi:hypothetical protein
MKSREFVKKLIHVCREWAHTKITILRRSMPSNRLMYCYKYGGTVTKITGSSSDDWIYWHFGYKFP